MNITSFITEYTGDVPNRQSDTPIAFADNVYNYQTWINEHFTPESLIMASQMNSVAQTVNQDALQVSISKTETNNAKNEAISARDEAVLAKDEIKGYVIPTEATYSPTTIKAIADMAETLNLTGAM